MMRFSIVIDIDEKKAKELMEQDQLLTERDAVLQQIDWADMKLVDARQVNEYYSPVEHVANLIWTEDDIVGSLEGLEIEPTEEVMERARQAVENWNWLYVQSVVGEEMYDALDEEFEEA